jgi:hypothetical protein
VDSVHNSRNNHHNCNGETGTTANGDQVKEVVLSITYSGKYNNIRNVDSHENRVCSLCFCNDPVVEYDLDVFGNIEKFDHQVFGILIRRKNFNFKNLCSLIAYLQFIVLWNFPKELVLTGRIFFKVC